MKHPLIYLFLGGAIVFLLMQTCRPEQKQGTLISKQNEIKHAPIFKNSNLPKETRLKKAVEASKQVFKSPELDDIIKRLSIENDSLKSIYLTLSPTQKDSVYSQTIEPKMFQWQTQDKNLIANIKGITIGEVKHIELDYIIKPERQKNFSLSFGIGSDLNATTPILKAGVGYKNIEVDYLRINNVNNIVVGYRFKL